jgi:hypothetical protein
LSSDLRHVGVGPDDEGQPITEIQRPKELKGFEKVSVVTDEAKVDVLRRSSPVKTKLKNEAALQNDAFSEMLEDAGEEAIEHEKLTKSIDFGTRNSPSDALLQRHPERFGRSIFTQRHSASERRVVAAALASRCVE